MKTKYIVATFAIVMAARAHAQQRPTRVSQNPQANLTRPEKIEIADAINLLIEDGVLKVFPNQCLQIDNDVINEFPKPAERLELTEAFKFLVDDGVLSTNANQCLEINGSIIDELRGMGLLDASDSQVLTICIGGRVGK